MRYTRATTRAFQLLFPAVRRVFLRVPAATLIVAPSTCRLAAAARGATTTRLETWSYQQWCSQRMTSHPRTTARWIAPRVITLVSPMIVVCTSVLYVDCAPIRAPIILPTRSERHCRLARDERRRRRGQTGRARSTRASGRGLRPRRAPRSHRGWFRAEVRGPGLRGWSTPPRTKGRKRACVSRTWRERPQSLRRWPASRHPAAVVAAEAAEAEAATGGGRPTGSTRPTCTGPPALTDRRLSTT